MNSSAEPNTTSVIGTEQERPHTQNDELDPASCSDADAIAVQGEDEASRLKALATDVRDQDDLERNVERQADQLLTEQANERDQKRLDKTQSDKNKLVSQIQKLGERLSHSAGSATIARIQSEIRHMEATIQMLDRDLEQIIERMAGRAESNNADSEATGEISGSKRMPHESQRDFLIRTGKITPFSKLPGRTLPRSNSTLQDVLLEAEEGEAEEDVETEEKQEVLELLSHRNLAQPGFVDDEHSEVASDFSERPPKRRRLQTGPVDQNVHQRVDAQLASTVKEEERSPDDEDIDEFKPDTESEEQVSEGHSSEDSASETSVLGTTRGTAKKPKTRNNILRNDDLPGLDDGNEKLFQTRLRSWISRRSLARRRAKARQSSTVDGNTAGLYHLRDQDGDERNDTGDMANTTTEEWHLPHPTRPDGDVADGFQIPGDIYPSLFNYQKTGVQWLWELYSQQVGGIVGDEMGLGKTIQIIAFLAGLHYCKKITRPIIVVAPATVMKQWVNEFHTWWPPFRVSILHTSGSGMVNVGREAQLEDDLLSQAPGSRRKPATKNQKAAQKIVNRVIDEGHILVTTYTGLQTYADMLIPVDWEYAVLDEGHKIRNPNTAITIYCKELRTANRIILSGTPMQNNLVELWSLFDFIFPMRLGTLVNFRNQFEIPIRQGGYANASNLQVQTAMKCAETLKDTISPYLLQRFKMDVAADLPKKTEQVLFCKLTKLQREAYESFLMSDELKAIMNGRRQVLYGVDILRKICNHPDLQDHRNLTVKPGYNYGSGAKSGKMQVVKALLELWKDQGHKTLLFAQHRIMLDILEKFIRSLQGFNLRRLDGNTPIHARQDMVDEFNNTPDAHVFLLTTKVGGLGINLTGANRVIIYDPDWNPSTDIQARERAWRLGQKREVMIYRLMTAGTIEEKIYHRQLFKQFLTNKILKDPKQRQTFQMQDLHDLFSLGETKDGATETSALFKGTEVNFRDDSAVAITSMPRQSDLSGQTATDVNGSLEENSSVRKMAGVAGLERFRGEDDGEQGIASGEANKSEARVMEGIFARAGVHSALEHDQIINGKRVITADPKIIEKEAKKVAAEAAKELKRAGEVARTVPVGTPTWTGQYGTAGRPEEQPAQRSFGRGRGGPSSASILAGLQNQQLANEALRASNLSTTGTVGQNAAGSEGADFMKMIRDYLVAHGGKVYTQMLIDHFNRFCTSPERTIEFKEMLKEIAKLDKGTRGRGSWVLKDEYSPASL